MDAGQVAVLRAVDLDSDRKAVGGQSRRGNGRGQIKITGVSGPEHLGGRGLRLSIDHDHTFPALALLVVGKSGGCGRGAQEKIIIAEKIGPS